MKNLVFDDIKCLGCRSCMMACSFAHGGSFSLAEARLRVTMNHHDDCFIAICIECPEKYCVAACPCGAITVNEQGVSLIDEDVCIACAACVAACPHRGLWPDQAAGRVLKCDMCGGAPACLTVCMPQAIRISNDKKEDA